MYQYNYNPFDSSPNLFPARQQPQQNQTQQTQQPQQSTQSQNNVILPEVNPTTFIESAKEVNELLKEVVKISNNLINTTIGRKIMEAAQQSNTEEIKRLIESNEGDDRLIKEMFDKGITVLFVSHNLAQVRSLCTRAIWLENGHVVEDGPVDAVTEHFEEKAAK